MRTLARVWLLFGCGSVMVAACGGDDGGSGTSDGGTTAAADSSSGSSGASASSTTSSLPNCEVEPQDCSTCWECAQAGACKETYDSCASSIECVGSLACIDTSCPADGLQQSCVDMCCQNCAEHNLCSLVDAVVTCIEQQCADLCGPATCGA